MTMTNHLVVFAKEPRMGRVKTRLAADIGSLAALAFYRKTVFEVTRQLARDARWQCGLAVTPDRAIFDGGPGGPGGPWPPADFRMSQGPGDLGQRMGRVMEILPPGPVIIIGGDVPDIRTHHIADAFAALDRNDAVFGPAKDGGYWLVGMKRRPVFLDIFQNVRWSSKHALADTVANLGPGKCHALLETLSDIDDGKDYRRWKNRTGPRASTRRSGTGPI